MRRLNKTLAGLMAAVMVLLGVSVTPVEADAAAPQEVDYATAEEFKIADYWGKGTNGENLVPVKDGYVFGGWYKDGAPIKQADISANGVEAYSTAVAKFVPSYVLSVKMQLNSTTEKNDGECPYTNTNQKKYTNMRLLSAVDSVKYQNVGFDIKLNATIPYTAIGAMTEVYKELAADGNKGKEAIVASETFGAPATHFIAAELTNLTEANLKGILYVTPYWTTIDGTKVEGASKYIRAWDGYSEHRYISVPVNILTNVNAAAGMVEMKYDSSKLNFIEWQTGVLYEEMAANTATPGTIKFVGNGDTVDATYMTGEEIYANVWFQYTGDLNTLKRNSLEFTMDTESFCSWDEKLFVDTDGKTSIVKAWDVLY